MSDTKHRVRRGLFAALATIAIITTVVTSFWGLLSLIRPGRDDAAPVTTTTTPVLTIKPLAVRPVVSAFVTTPEQCPAPGPVPPDQPMRVCDIPKTAVYDLKPEGIRLQLTDVDSIRNPLTGAQVVQMSMTTESASEFAKFTAGLVGQQVAFVRNGTVVWGPKITTPIDGQVLQLTGELTPEQAAEVARMLRDGS
jgi:hypothetical protein